jgi:phi13 family phage major tail protein
MNKYEFGLKGIHVAFFDPEVVDGDYGPVMATPGGINLTVTPAGESTEHYHDDKKAGEETSNNGYTGSLETSTIPADVLAEMQGHTVDADGGIIEKATDKPKEFALMFETDGSDEKIRTVFYRVKAERPETDNQTNNPAPNISTKTMNITMMSEDKTGDELIKYAVTESNPKFDTFFDSVVIPIP